jgi:hypothetical protein
MASIHKHPHSRYYYCAFIDADGKRVFKSTKQTQISNAWRLAHALEDAARDARQGTVTSAHMSKIIASTVAKIHPDSSVLTNTREWFNSWADDVATSKAPGTGKRYKGIITEFLSVIGKKADQPLTTLNKNDIQGFQEAKLRSGLSRSSVNMIVKTLLACLGMAVKHPEGILWSLVNMLGLQAQIQHQIAVIAIRQIAAMEKLTAEIKSQGDRAEITKDVLREICLRVHEQAAFARSDSWTIRLLNGIFLVGGNAFVTLLILHLCR